MSSSFDAISDGDVEDLAAECRIVAGEQQVSRSLGAEMTCRPAHIERQPFAGNIPVAALLPFEGATQRLARLRRLRLQFFLEFPCPKVATPTRRTIRTAIDDRSIPARPATSLRPPAPA